MAQNPRARFAAQLQAATTIDQWSDERFALARTLAYRPDAPRAATNGAATLPAPAYLRDMQPVAEARLTLSGYRLADLLRSMFAR